jgi:membrane protease YdiL (CAAX protease family)
MGAMENIPESTPPPEEEPPGIWTTWSRGEILGLFFMVLTGNFFFQLVVYQAAEGMFLPVCAGAVLGVFLPVAFLTRTRRLSLSRDFFLDRPPWYVLAASALLAVTTLVPTSLLAELSLRLSPADPEVVARMQALLPATPGQWVLAGLAVVLLGPLAEEIIFRGILHRLAAGLWGPVAAAAVSSLVFAILHGEAWIIFGLIGIGVVLAVVFEATGSVTACWITHAVHNAISLFLMVRQGVGPLEPSPLGVGDWLWGAGSLAVALLIMRYLMRWNQAWKNPRRTGYDGD